MTIPIPVSQLRYSKEVWPRFTAEEERIALFAELLKSGEAVPAIEVVISDDGSYLIADGMHRTLAVRRIQRDSIEAIVIEPEPGETPAQCANRRALETATKVALPLTKAERRHAALRLLNSEPPLTHRAIARLVGVSHDSVDRWAKETQSEPQESNSDSSYVFPSADDIARRLVGTLVRLEDSRGFLDYLSPSRMGRHLAQAFEAQLGEGALAHAERVEGWINTSVSILRSGGR